MTAKSGRARPARRGRPHKFGEPSRLVALTLPQSVLRGLRRLDPDIARAVVGLFRRRVDQRVPASPSEDAALVSVGAGRALIAVDRHVLPELPGVALIPFGEDLAFLALTPGTTLPELELAILDLLDDGALGAEARKALQALRARLREWRRDPRLRFETRSILVAERVPARGRR